MAVEKRGSAWRVRIRRRGYPDISATFDRKADAEAWERKILREMDLNTYIPQESRVTVEEALESYLQSPACLNRKTPPTRSILARIKKRFGSLRIQSITPSLVAGWRDQLLSEHLNPWTVKHHLNTLSVVLKHAVQEMGAQYNGGSNPVQKVAKPSTASNARDRRLLPGEEEKLLEALKEQRNSYMLPLVQFAIETAARQGEILRLLWDDVDLNRRIMLLRNTKNGEDRVVPLSSRALEILKALPRESERVFPVSQTLVVQAWQRACSKAKISNLRFHDLRHEAISRLGDRGFSVLELSTISGHKTLSMLKRYTHLHVEALAKKLG